MVLPIYKSIETHIDNTIAMIDEDNDPYQLKAALQAGRDKLKVHFDKALEGQYALLGTGAKLSVIVPS